MDCDRRRYLALLSGALAGSAGCLGGSTPADEADRPTASATSTETPTGTPVPTDGIPETGTRTGNGTDAPAPKTGEGRLVLRSVDPDPGTSMRVYPTDLREPLRTAAQRDTPVRTVGSAHVYAPQPLLPAIETVELVDPDGEAGGVYAVDCRGGTRYHLLVGAEEASPPADESATPVTELPEERRDMAVAAIESEWPRVYPETELGEWVRTEFFDRFFSYEGTTYRGKEVQQTDAAFFSTEVWYVLELTSTDDATGAVTLDLAPVDSPVRTALDPLLADRSKHQETVRADDVSGPVRSFLVDTDRIMTHTVALALDVE